MSLWHKKIIPIKFEDVKLGQVYRFVNGAYTNEYYAEVIHVTDKTFITYIYGRNSLVISLESNFDYHSKRMILMGDKEEHGHLCINDNIKFK